MNIMTTTKFDISYITKTLTDWYNVKRPGTKPTTIKCYVTLIKSLNSLLCNDESYDIKRFFDDECVMAALKKKQYKNETIRKYINSLIALFRSTATDETIINKYSSYLVSLNDSRTASLNDRKVDVKQFDYSEEIKARLKKKFLRRVARGEKDKSYHTNAKKFVIFSLYTLHPPLRSEYADMFMVDKYDDSMDQNFNYMDIKEKMFVLCSHKSLKKQGVVKIKINEELFDIIMKYRPLYYRGEPNSGPLLVNKNNDRIAHSGLCRLIKKIFKIGPTELRRYEVSKLLQKFIELEKQSEELARLMLHTQITQKQYYLHNTTPVD
jgi:hypothetical protein